jgi:transposase
MSSNLLRSIMKKKYIVRLTEEERQALTRLVHIGKAAAYRRTHAQVLLWADEGEQGPGLMDREVAHTAGVSEKTVVRLRQQFVEAGLEAALERKPRVREKSRVLDGESEARLVALMCSEPPPGQSRWTLRLLGGRLVELGVVESISHESVRQSLKKMLLNPGGK